MLKSCVVFLLVYLNILNIVLHILRFQILYIAMCISQINSIRISYHNDNVYFKDKSYQNFLSLLFITMYVSRINLSEFLILIVYHYVYFTHKFYQYFLSVLYIMMHNSRMNPISISYVLKMISVSILNSTFVYAIM